MNYRTTFTNNVIILLVLLPLILSCTAEHQNIANCVTGESWGFWGGLWHGSIAPISWLVSLFNSNVEVFAVNNNGGWYTFGFVVGIGSFSSSIKFVAHFIIKILE
jgi:hypothetical protein